MQSKFVIDQERAAQNLQPKKAARNSVLPPESEFSGGLLGMIGINLLQFVIVLFTLGLGFPWAIMIKEKWFIEHTEIDGKFLTFDGTGLELLGNSLKWFFFTLITLGIYGLWLPIKMRQWIVKHTHTV